MIANEAPEKLYLHPTVKGNVGASWLTFPLTNEDIEYTRTDAFIKKAEGWLREVQKGFILTDKDITDFVNCMKGE